MNDFVLVGVVRSSLFDFKNRCHGADVDYFFFVLFNYIWIDSFGVEESFLEVNVYNLVLFFKCVIFGMVFYVDVCIVY